MNEGKMVFEEMKSSKTTSAMIRHALLKEGIYLPNHKKRMTHTHYMKTILNLSREYYLIKDVRFVHVPSYAELAPENVLRTM